MDKIKKHQHAVVLVSLVVIVVSFAYLSASKNHYSLADFGVSPPRERDCSQAKDPVNSSTTVSFNAPDVPSMRDKIKELIKKHNGSIVSDSLESYWGEGEYVSEDSSAYITAVFETSRAEFLSELSVLIEDVGGVNEGYNYTDGSGYDSYSPYGSCASMMHDVAADFLELKILAKALKQENRIKNIALLSRSVNDSRIALQESVDAVNSFFTVSDKPSVDISIYTIRKDGDIILKPVPMY